VDKFLPLSTIPEKGNDTTTAKGRQLEMLKTKTVQGMGLSSADLKVWVKRINGMPFGSEYGGKCDILDMTVRIDKPFWHERYGTDVLLLDVGNFGWNMRAFGHTITSATFTNEDDLKKRLTRILKNRGLDVVYWGEDTPAGVNYR
jgi:hypothetical protein